MTIQVKLKVGRAGLNFTQDPGQVIDVNDDEAGRLIISGQAIAVNDGDDAKARAAAAGYDPTPLLTESTRQQINAPVANQSAPPVDASGEDDDDDIDSGLTAEPAPQTAIAKAKAKKAAAKKS
jgi:hypothetical protein